MDRDAGVEGALAQLGDGHGHHLRLEVAEQVGDEIVGHRPGRRSVLQLHEDRRGFRVADPDRQELVAVRGLQEDDRLLAD